MVQDTSCKMHLFRPMLKLCKHGFVMDHIILTLRRNVGVKGAWLELGIQIVSAEPPCPQTRWKL